MRLSHIDKNAKAAMVDITDKAVTARNAVAQAEIKTKTKVIELIKKNKTAKGNVFTVAQVAGIQAAKIASSLIPLAHPLMLTHVAVNINIIGKNKIRLETEVTTVGKTGPDLEALTGAAVASLTIYDMCKGVDREMEILYIRLLEKTGGRSGTYVRKAKR